MGRLNRLVSLVVLVCFVFNTAVSDYALALSPMPASERPAAKADVYAAAQQAFAAKSEHGQIDFAAYISSYTPAQNAGQPTEWQIVDTEYARYGEVLGNDSIFGVTSLVDAVNQHLNRNYGTSKSIKALAEDFDPKDGNGPALARISTLGGFPSIKIHSAFEKCWNYIRANDIWFTYRTADGTTHTESAAWAIFDLVFKRGTVGLPEARERHALNQAEAVRFMLAALKYIEDGRFAKSAAPGMTAPEDVVGIRTDIKWITPEEATSQLNAIPHISSMHGLKELSEWAEKTNPSHLEYLNKFKPGLEQMAEILRRTRQVDELNKLADENALVMEGETASAAGMRDTQIKRLDIVRSVSELILQLVPEEAGIDNPAHLAKIKNIFVKEKEFSRLLVKYFETRFNPDNSLNQRGKAAGDIRLNHILKMLRTNMKSSTAEEHFILEKAIRILIATVKTNYYVDERINLVFRINPRAIVGDDESGALVNTPPSGLIWVHVPYGVYGAHTRYIDEARGGLRCMESSVTALQNQVLATCGALTVVQNDKHSDIPEAGSKGAYVYKESSNAIAAFVGYLDGLITCMKEDDLDRIVVSSDAAMIDPLYLGPDVGTGEFSDIATALAWTKGLDRWRLLMTGKSQVLGGVSHKSNNLLNPPEKGNRVTSQGVMKHVTAGMVRYLRDIGKIESKDGEPIILKVTGGFDGDVGSGVLERSMDYYGDRAVIRAVVDGSGVMFDPQGLSHDVMKQMYKDGATASTFPVDRLNKGGFVAIAKRGSGEDSYITLDGESLKYMNTRALDPEVLKSLGVAGQYMPRAGLKDDEPLVKVLKRDSDGRPSEVSVHTIYLRDAMFFIVKSDMLITGSTGKDNINQKNWPLYFDWDDKPASIGIVHGANVFISSDATVALEKKGIVIEPDEKANSVGVEISSRAEVDFNQIFGIDEINKRFLAAYFEQVLAKCLDNATRKFWALRVEVLEHPDESVVTKVSPRMSSEIAELALRISRSNLVGDRKSDYSAAALDYLKNYFPDISDIDKRYPSTLDRVFARMPVNRVRSIAAKVIAKDIVLNLGTGAVSRIAKNTGSRQMDVVAAYLKVAGEANKMMKMAIDNKDGVSPTAQIAVIEAFRRELNNSIENSLKQKPVAAEPAKADTNDVGKVTSIINGLDINDMETLYAVRVLYYNGVKDTDDNQRNLLISVFETQDLESLRETFRKVWHEIAAKYVQLTGRISASIGDQSQQAIAVQHVIKMPAVAAASKPAINKDVSGIADKLGLKSEEWEPYAGRDVAKVDAERVLARLNKEGRKDGKLIFVTAINPTTAGEGKTCTSISLTQGLGRIGKNVVLGLREPSLGPVMGLKGGAMGKGKAAVTPDEKINLHFTGDIHAVTYAHNLLSSAIDHYLYREDNGVVNPLNIDKDRIVWPRVIDLNDAALRDVVVGVNGKIAGKTFDIQHKQNFHISVASEVMAILAIAKDIYDLRARLDKIIVAYTKDGKPVTVAQLKVGGAMTKLLEQAVKPNLVQTVEGQPVFVHAGPFGNIAHGCNSLIADRLGLKLSDYFVTEVGFGADLGAEKFLDIACREGGLRPDLSVIVATAKALEEHGGYTPGTDKVAALKKGLANLGRHIENMKKFGMPVLVAVNRFPKDTPEELQIIKEYCSAMGVRAEINNAVAEGGEGATDLAKAAVEIIGEGKADYRPIYDLKTPIKDKIEKIAREIYGADGVEYEPKAEEDMARIIALGYSDLPICTAKTQYSFSHDPKLKGAPTGWKLKVKEVSLSAGVGFIIPVTGEINRMPALPTKSEPNYWTFDDFGRLPETKSAAPGMTAPVDEGMDYREIDMVTRVLERDVIEMLAEAGSGHPGGSLSMLKMLAALYFGSDMQNNRIMNYDPKDPTWANRDRFVLSKGHAAPGLYAVLGRAGFFPTSEFAKLRKFGAKLQGHTDMTKTPGVDMSAGSLGVGISAAVGMALAAKMDGKTYTTYTMMGDGEVQEGQVDEAARWAAAMGLDNLVAFLDWNGMQIDGKVTDTDLNYDSQVSLWKARGWRTISVDGEDAADILDALVSAREKKGAPVIIVARTKKGAGLPKMDKHGSVPKKDEAQPAFDIIDKDLARIDVNALTERMRISAGVDALSKAMIDERNSAAEASRNKAVKDAISALGQKYTDAVTVLEKGYSADKKVSTRTANGDELALVGIDEHVVAMSADLKGSVMFEKFAELFGTYSPSNTIGRYVPAGIREAHMVSMAVGLASCGKIPAIGTFSIFTTRMVDQLNAILNTKLPMIIVGTHGGLATGPDGRTHQDAHSLGVLGTLPGVRTYEGADAEEERVLLRHIYDTASKDGGIHYIRPARLDTPIIAKPEGWQEGARRGFYTIYDSRSFTAKKDTKYDVVIVSSGVTAVDAIAAAKELAAQGKSVKVINVTQLKAISDAGNRKAFAGLVNGGDHVISAIDSLPEILGDRINNVLVQEKVYPESVKALGINKYGESGTPAELYALHGFDKAGIIKACGGATITSKSWGEFKGTPVSLYTLTNSSGASVKISSLGGTVVSINVPDKDRNMADVVLGHDSLNPYTQRDTNPYFGSIIGRYGNRIAEGKFTIDGITYNLATNNGPNHLHGGKEGFDMKVWKVEEFRTAEGVGLRLRYTSPDGEERYPGNLEVVVTYTWTHNNELKINYSAKTDKATPVNLTNHSYFNLAGQGNGTIMGHKLSLNSEAITPVADANAITTGGFMPVDGTPFDFRAPAVIGENIRTGSADKQLGFGSGGIDHNFVLSGGARTREGLFFAARLIDPVSRRTLIVETTEPSIQAYTGNFLNGSIKGKGGAVYNQHAGLCLETQHAPDSPNKEGIEGFPTTILRPGETYNSTTVYKFGVDTPSRVAVPVEAPKAAPAVKASPLAAFKDINQRIWLDGLTWEMMGLGVFNKLVKDHNITGVTTNPTLIKAYLSDKEVLAKVGALAQKGLSREDIYFEIIKELALSVIAVFKNNGVAGKFSVELSPDKANDVAASVAEAKRWTDIDPDHMMVKVAATEAGYKIIEEVTATGRNVNATLIFTIDQYRKVAEAYVTGLEKALAAGHDLSKIYSVASFFLSRWDVELAKNAPESLQGKIANAVAIDVYNRAFKEIFTSGRFKALQAKGARAQDFLVASTGSKGKDMIAKGIIPEGYGKYYPALIYVEPIEGSNVVNTLPLSTINTMIDKGVKVANTIDDKYAWAPQILAEAGKLANLDEVGAKLFAAGMKSFLADFATVMGTIDEAIAKAKTATTPESAAEARNAATVAQDQGPIEAGRFVAADAEAPGTDFDTPAGPDRVIDTGKSAGVTQEFIDRVMGEGPIEAGRVLPDEVDPKFAKAATKSAAPGMTAPAENMPVDRTAVKEIETEVRALMAANSSFESGQNARRSAGLRVLAETATLQEVISDYVAEKASLAAVPELEYPDWERIYKAIDMMRGEKLEILIPQQIRSRDGRMVNFSLTENAKRTLRQIKENVEARGGVFTWKEYTGYNLAGVLKENGDATKVLVTEESSSGSIGRMLEADPELFRKVRLYNMAASLDPENMTKEALSVCQMREMVIGILIGMHKENNIVTKTLLTEMLTDRVEGTTVDNFIANIPEKSDETMVQRRARLGQFLKWRVSLVETLGKQLRLLEKFVWSAA